MNPHEHIRDRIVDRIKEIRLVKNPTGPRSNGIPVLAFKDGSIASKLAESLQRVGIGVVVKVKASSIKSDRLSISFAVEVAEKPVDNRSDLGSQVTATTLASECMAALHGFDPGKGFSRFREIDMSEIQQFDKGIDVHTLTISTSAHFSGRR